MRLRKKAERTIPTGPKPIKAMFTASVDEVGGFLMKFSRMRVGLGYGFLVKRCKSFGCCKSWRAAK